MNAPQLFWYLGGVVAGTCGVITGGVPLSIFGAATMVCALLDSLRRKP